MKQIDDEQEDLELIEGDYYEVVLKGYKEWRLVEYKHKSFFYSDRYIPQGAFLPKETFVKIRNCPKWFNERMREIV